MAKKNDQLAGGFKTENTGGVLSGLLADEEHLDRRAMFRLGTWGVASVGAVIIAVLANQSAIKTRRDDAAALDLTRQSQQIQSVARESQNETRRLASAIDTLNGDRDRLYSRLTTIEQGLDSVTGAIAKQTAVAAAPPATPPAATPASPAPAPQPATQTAAPDPAPAVAPVTSTVAPATPTAEKPAPEKPRAEAKNPAPPATVAASTPAAAAPSNQPATPPTSSPVPLVASKSLMAPPDAAAAKLTEPEPSAKAAATPAPSPPEPGSTAPAPPAPTPDVAASKPAAEKKVATAEPAPTTAPAPLAVKRTEFAVDVGGANSVGGLRALWRGLLKSRSNAPLATLQPLIVVKERDNGLGMQLRLVAGPLGDAAAAARICARLAENEHPCETTIFDGQRLALRADDVPTTTESIAAKPEKPATEKSSPDKSGAEAATEPKPVPEKPPVTKPGSNRYFHRRSYYAPRRTAVVEEPPKKPETSSSISSFFASRIHPQ
jgi:hypothetical protein